MIRTTFTAACLLPLFIIAVATPPALAQPAPAEPDRPTAVVYLLSGQSNMQGVGKIDQLPENWQQPVDGAHFWNGESFETLDPSRTRLSAREGDFGPELGFARLMRDTQPETEIHIIKFYRSGQPLHHGWDANQWVGGEPEPGRRNFYPGFTPDDANIGRHYQDMMQQVQSAFEHLREEGYDPVLRGIVWMQGEQDAKHEASANEYAHSLARLKSRIEEDLESESVTFVFGQVCPHTPPLPRFTHRTLLRERMAQADMRSENERAIPGVLMVPTEGMPLNNDTVHYNAQGQSLLGQAFALAMLQGQTMLVAEAVDVGED